MNIKITNKEGITLKTKGKYCTEDISVAVDESLLGGEGAISGTPVSNKGFVGNVYFNTDMSVEEVVSLLSQLDYNVDGTIYIPLGSNNSTLAIQKGENYYQISTVLFQNNEGLFVIFSSVNDTDFGVSFKGWNPNFDGSLLFDDTTINTFENEGVTYEVGHQNELIKDLISITPFKATGGTHKFITLEGTAIDGGFDFGRIDSQTFNDNINFWDKLNVIGFLEWNITNVALLVSNNKFTYIHTKGEYIIPSFIIYLGSKGTSLGLQEFLKIEISIYDIESEHYSDFNIKTINISGATESYMNDNNWTQYPTEVLNQFVGMTDYIKLHLLVKA